MLQPQYKMQFYNPNDFALKMVQGQEYENKYSSRNATSDYSKYDMAMQQHYENDAISLAINNERTLPLNLNIGSNLYSNLSDLDFPVDAEESDKKLILCPKSEQMWNHDELV